MNVSFWAVWWLFQAFWAYTHAHALPNENPNKGMCFGNIYLLVFYAIAKLLALLSSVHLVFCAPNVDQCNFEDYFHCIWRELFKVFQETWSNHTCSSRDMELLFLSFLNFLAFASCLFYLSKAFWEKEKLSVKNSSNLKREPYKVANLTKTKTWFFALRNLLSFCELAF